MAMRDSSSNKNQGPSTQMLACYAFFIVSAGAIHHLVADGNFSSILTVSVLVQCLGLALLALQVMSTGSVAGISARTLKLEVFALCCRLSSTLWLNGYLPSDLSGDHVFQAIDITSVCILAWLLHQVLVVNRHTYQAEEDTFATGPLVLVAVILATILHAKMNNRPIFDTLWMTGLFTGSVAVCPQMWLITRTGGRVQSLTSHHIAATAASKGLAFIFMWYAREDVVCKQYLAGFNHAKWAILGAYVLHMILLGDFAYYYTKAIIANGFNCHLDTLESCNV